MDLEIRGPGDFLGTRARAATWPELLRIADLLRDTLLVAVARNTARAEIDRDPKPAGAGDAPRRAPALGQADRAVGGG
ncbi:MAG: hypothetical protein R3E53_13570 [Myxococcota bacterium]